MSAAVLPARCRACSAAPTAIWQSTDHSSLLRSGKRGAMRCGSRMPSLSITKRLLMPEAFSINAALDSVSACTSPRPMAAALSLLNCCDVGIERLHQLFVGDAVGRGIQASAADHDVMHGRSSNSCQAEDIGTFVPNFKAFDSVQRASNWQRFIQSCNREVCHNAGDLAPSARQTPKCGGLLPMGMGQLRIS